MSLESVEPQIELNGTTQIVLGTEEDLNKGKLKLRTADGYMFEVPTFWVKDMCSLINDMIEDSEDNSEEIPFPNIENHEIMRKVLDYCEYHHNNRAAEIEKPLSGKLEDHICEFDQKFINLSDDLLINLILAANYLACNDLLNLCAAKIASSISGKSVEEMREYFGVENDFTPEEEEKIREENKWIEEE